MTRMNLPSYLDTLASKGRYCFSTEDAVAALHTSQVAVQGGLGRLRSKGKVATPLRSFHVIVPPEYRSLGCLPPEQFIPQLMAYIGEPYYAGLLTAAQYHGAAHQAPQMFHVLVAKPRSPISCGKVRVSFIVRHNIPEIPTNEKNTLRGNLRISSPEATAFDLVGYPDHCGGFSHIATVLKELAEQLDADKLLRASLQSPLPWSQRLGYLLELVEEPALAAPLADKVAKTAREYVALRSDGDYAKAPRNQRWKLFINDVVEPDL